MGIVFVFPSEGVKLGKVTLDFPTVSDFFAVNNPNLEKEKELESDLKELFKESTPISEIDSAIIQQRLDSLHRYRKSIQITDAAKPAIHRFFDALDNANNRIVRIMHYGDSQIEADRITSYFRGELQNKFGGFGVGLFPVIDVAPKMSVNISYSENWKRYSGFGQKEPEVKHNKYGAMLSFCRFAPIPSGNIITDTTYYHGWIKINKPKASHGKTRSYQQLKIFLSNSHASVNYVVLADNTVIKNGIIDANTPFGVITTSFDKTPEEITISFDGKDSPNILGISLEGKTGAVVDNIPLRGSSGTVFSQLDHTSLANMFANLSPDMIILEFGGNVMPYIKDEAGAKEYGNWFKSQINFLKRLNPKAAFIVIGPGDMSVKDKTEYVTYPNLEFVRDALKDAALANNCLFWDMYEVMGGKNSMNTWVNAVPPLAAPDYIHFSPLGAKKIGEEFYKNIIQMYQQYKGVKPTQAEPKKPVSELPKQAENAK